MRSKSLLAGLFFLTCAFVLQLAGAAPALAIGDGGRIVVSAGASQTIDISASGNFVVWSALSGGKWGVWGCDLADRAVVPISVGASQRQGTDVSGNIVVWSDDRNGGIDPYTGMSNADIYGYNRSTGTEFPICTDFGWQTDPRIDGNIVVWEEWVVPTTGGIDYQVVRGIDLSTNRRFTVADSPGNHWDAQVSNGWVVYADYEDIPGKGDSYAMSRGSIRAYEVSTGRTITLTTKPGIYYHPSIGPTGLVAWMDQSWKKNAQFAQVDACNLYDRKPLPIAWTKYGEDSPSVGLNTVVFRNHDNSGGCTLVGFDTLAGTRFSINKVNGSPNYLTALDSGAAGWIESYSGGTRVVVDQPTVIGTFSATDVYGAAVAQSREDFPGGADTVVVANGGNWDDIVVGAGLAGDDSPLLLTGRVALPPAVAAELARLAPKHVEVVGGRASVSDGVLAAISSVVGTDTVVERTGGANPVDTSLDALTAAASSSALAFASTQRGLTSTPGFGGAVVVVPAGGKVLSGLVTPALIGHHIPVVFANKKFSAGDLRRLRAAGVKRAIIVGGTKDVSALAGKQLSTLLGKRNVGRIAGKDVYQTAARFDEYAIRHFGMKIDGVGITVAAATTDSLVAALKGGRHGSLLLLTGTKKLSSYAAGELKARRASVRHALYVGRGKRLVSRAVRKAVRLIVH